jgi:hypothetical protein
VKRTYLSQPSTNSLLPSSAPGHISQRMSQVASTPHCTYTLDCSNTGVYTLFSTVHAGKRPHGCGSTGEATARRIRKRTPSIARARTQWGRFRSSAVADVQATRPQEGSEPWYNKKYDSTSFKLAPANWYQPCVKERDRNFRAIAALFERAVEYSWR